MRKTNFLLFLCLFMASQVFAQQSQSFAEHWFGVKPQSGVQNSAKTTLQKAPARAKLRAASTNSSGVITLDLNQPTNPKTFSLGANGVWTETYNDVDYPFIEFNNSAFMFSHLIGGEGSAWDGSFWDGFTYSKNGDNTDYSQGENAGWIGREWGNMAGGGIKTDAEGNILTDNNGVALTDPDVPYLVGYWSFMDGYYDYRVLTVIFDDVYQAREVYVNSSPWSYYANISGDGYARALNQEGDYFKLFIHGLDENYEDNGKTVEYVLAEYKNGVLHQSPNWEKVDLSALGEIGGIYFTMESTDSDPVYGMSTAAYFCMDKLQVYKAPVPEHTFTITVPEDASVYVGSKGSKHYVPFTEKEAVYTSTFKGNTTFYYNISGQHNYRVSKAGALTQAGLFSPNASSTGLKMTDEQLYSHSPKETDHNVTNNNGYNVADIFLNINEKGHLKLSLGDTYQLVNLRTWQLTNSTISNYFIEPDFHYTVINENGNVDNSIVSVNNNGLLTAVSNGTAIVLVTYDAINFHSADGGPFFGALWAENTGVFVVSVDMPASDITSGMLVNETMNATSASKLAATAVDAELDVFYYLEETGGYDYTFTPANVISVALAQPQIVKTEELEYLQYNGFSTNDVTANSNGSYTVHLVQGRNIVKMTSASGAVEYQVLSAKAVTYTVSNLTKPDEKFSPGDEVSVKFNTLYHPVNKLAGIYNMSAGIQYSSNEADFALILGPGQYTFASRAQEYKIKIPADFTESQFSLTNGVIKVNGYGSPYGDHRKITLANGAAPNMNATVKTAYFGSLPNIRIKVGSDDTGIPSVTATKISVYPNPFVDYIVVGATESGTANIFDLSGKIVLTEKLTNGSNHISTSALPKGIYILNIGGNAVKIVK